MAETLLSSVITSLDATPPVRTTGGAGAQSYQQTVYGSVQPGATQTSPSIYKLCRVPSTAIINKVTGETTGTITTLTGDVTIFYSDRPQDNVGAGSGNSGLVNSLSGASALFATAHTFGADTRNALVDLTNLAGNFGPQAGRIQPLWQAAGLTKDPGGFFDVVVQTTATNSLTAGAILALRVDYTMPYSS